MDKCLDCEALSIKNLELLNRKGWWFATLWTLRVKQAMWYSDIFVAYLMLKTNYLAIAT